MSSVNIIWTKIDEAPALASYSLLPILQAYAKGSGVEFETSDISLSGRILANFPDQLTDPQKIPDEYTEYTAKPDMDGKLKDVEEYIDDMDHLELKEIADEIKDPDFLNIKMELNPVKKASGGLAYALGE